MARTLDGPDTTAARVLVCEEARGRVTVSARCHYRLRKYCTRARGDDRERVLIAMGVDSDHVVQLVCKHPTDPPTRRVRYAGLEQGNRAAGL
jgi:hypothetical protein